MNILKNNNLKLNFVLASIGLEKKLISENEILKELDIAELEKLSETVLTNLYLSVDSASNFSENLNKISSNLEKKKEIGLKIWQFAFLKEVNEDKNSISEKLKKIAAIWADFDYPDDWKEFIYYMPVGINEEASEINLLRKFQNYLDLESNNIKNYYEITNFR